MNRSNPQPRSLSADQLGTALHEVGGTTRPRYLEDIVAQAEHTRQRPAWTFTERWLPMSIALRREGVPRAAILFTLFLLLLAVVALATMFAGAVRPPAPLVVTNGLIAFVSGDDIVVVQPDGTGRRTLVDGTGELGAMAFSPDGKRLAYWANEDGRWDLIVVDADGANPVTIAHDALNPFGPSWSPDGAQIAYADEGIASGDQASARMFVAASDGSGAREVGDPTLEVRTPAWSPDGSTIAFGGSDGTERGVYRLYLMNPDGSNLRQVSDVRGDAWAFVVVDWSRDGSKIVAQAGDADNMNEWDIWVINVADGSAMDVGAHEGGDEQIPSWAPDRDALAWAHAGVVVLEPGAEPVDLPFPGHPVWSPDGRLLLVETGGRLAVVDPNGVVQATVEGTTENLSWQPVLSGG